MRRNIAQLAQLGLRLSMYSGFGAEDRWQLSAGVTLATKQPWTGHGSEPLMLQARWKQDHQAEQCPITPRQMQAKMLTIPSDRPLENILCNCFSLALVKSTQRKRAAHLSWQAKSPLQGHP